VGHVPEEGQSYHSLARHGARHAHGCSTVTDSDSVVVCCRVLVCVLSPPPRPCVQTFTKWCNNHLRKKGFGPLEDVQKEFETGVKLMELINALYNKDMPKFNKKPVIRAQKLDNISLALKMVDDAKIKTNFLKSNHLADFDLKMILGMIWVHRTRLLALGAGAVHAP
jgi:hypothetical protein